MKRENWGSRLGLVLAVAGSAVGLGNFLRFPVQMASNGGSAFMVPYLLAIVFLGFPLLLVEMTMGRYAGSKGHGTSPAIFDMIWKSKYSKYIGILGLILPLTVVIYYFYVESWSLAYSFFSISDTYKNIPSSDMGLFLQSFQGVNKSPYFSTLTTAYVFFIITFLVNMFILYKGVNKGIERLARIGMPLLFIMAIALLIKILSIGTPNAAHPTWNVLNGLKYIWSFDLSRLKESQIWIAASGQVFFTLSVGFGVIQTYASYMKRKEDIVGSAIATTSTNEFAEIILGSSIAIPIAVAFFGVAETTNIAKSGAFNLAFIVLPNIFKTMSGGMLWGFVWFFLLFLAGITSSVSLAQPIISFLEDELNISRKKAVMYLGSFIFLAVQPIILFLSRGYLDELDFWSGTFMILVFAFIEIILFTRIFGKKEAWKELHLGANFKLPKIFYYIINYITPIYLLTIIAYWTYDKAWGVLIMKNVSVANKPFVIGARLFMIGLFAIFAILIRFAWKRRTYQKEIS